MRLLKLFRFEELNGEAGRRLFESAGVDVGLVISLRYPPMRSWGKVVHKDWGRVRVLVNDVEVVSAGMGKSPPMLLTDVTFPCEVVVESYRRRRGRLGLVEIPTAGLGLVEVTPPHSSGLPNTTGPMGVHLVDFRPEPADVE